MSRERIQKALDSLIYLPHLQAQHDEPSLPVAAAPPPGGASGAAAAARGRPWDRGDLFRRLATFKSGTWFCKPAAISPVECARRGWTNTAVDLLSCEFCKAKVSCPIAPELLPEEAAAAAARYASKLVQAHDSACPWRAATSSLSLLHFPPLTQESVRRDFDARCAALKRLVCLPPMAPEPYQALAAAAGKQQLDQLLLQGPAGRQQEQQQAQAQQAQQQAQQQEQDASTCVNEGTAVMGSQAFDARARMLALCGWDLKVMTATTAEPSSGPGGSIQAQAAEEQLPAQVGPESAALQCSLCAARAGLWTFFPQCRPQVLQPPRRPRPGAVTSPSATVSRAAMSRNVATDIGTTIAGGAMAPPAAGAAAPFVAAQQPAAFGGPAGGSSAAANGAVAAGAGAAPGGAAGPAGSAAQQHDAAAAAGPAAAAAPFGSCGSSGGVPVFGFAALQSAQPVAPAAAPAPGSAAKRKHPDFSWTAVLADINAKSAADKRSRPAAAEAGSLAGGVAAGATGAAAGPRRGQQLSQQHAAAAAAAAAAKYRAVQAAPLDPLALHRPFCPWVNTTQAGEKQGRCGWRWCLEQLAAPSLAHAAALAAADSEAAAEDGGGGRGKEWRPAKLLRAVLSQVDVHK